MVRERSRVREAKPSRVGPLSAVGLASHAHEPPSPGKCKELQPAETSSGQRIRVELCHGLWRLADEVIGVLEGCRARGPHSLTGVSPNHSWDCPGSSLVLPSPPLHPCCLSGTSTSLLKQKTQQDPSREMPGLTGGDCGLSAAPAPCWDLIKAFSSLGIGAAGLGWALLRAGSIPRSWHGEETALPEPGPTSPKPGCPSQCPLGVAAGFVTALPARGPHLIHHPHVASPGFLAPWIERGYCSRSPNTAVSQDPTSGMPKRGWRLGTRTHGAPEGGQTAPGPARGQQAESYIGANGIFPVLEERT